MICGVELLRVRRGLISSVARTLDVNHVTVMKWRLIPCEHVFIVAEMIGVPPERIRPDLFTQDPLRRHLVTAQMIRSMNVLPGKTFHRTGKPRRKMSVPRTEKQLDRTRGANGRFVPRSTFVTSNAEANAG